MINKDNIKIGDIIYVMDLWTGCLVSGKVYEIQEQGVLVHGKYYINKDGSEGDCYYGSTGGTWENVFLSAKEGYEELKRRHKDNVKRYCDEIVDIESIIQFPLRHCLLGDEYTDWDAVKAYKIRAKELFGVDLSKM